MSELTEQDEFVFNQWLPALRSGDWSQARSYLAFVDGLDSNTPLVTGFCCLGVACELRAKDNKLEKSVSVTDLEVRYGSNPKDMTPTVLPKSLARWLGIDTGGEFVINLPHVDFQMYLEASGQLHIKPDGEDERTFQLCTGLATLNDQNMPFTQIADVIEYCWTNKLFDEYPTFYDEFDDYDEVTADA